MGHVYFIHAIGTGRVKIGATANDVWARLRTVDTHCPYPVRLYSKIPTQHPFELESTIHNRLAHARVHNEWFELTKEETDNVLEDYGQVRLEKRTETIRVPVDGQITIALPPIPDPEW